MNLKFLINLFLLYFLLEIMFWHVGDVLIIRLWIYINKFIYLSYFQTLILRENDLTNFKKSKPTQFPEYHHHHRWKKKIFFMFILMDYFLECSVIQKHSSPA